ncbi:zinc finger protein 596-like [Folsomia candida]|uniref:zinc finger protein 596-like n=1 Tax=Folsomia candida TaxID=158441 RepID=UPI001604BEA2|nr:zinc finger protein 596-like [Folsomia candida]
MGPHPVKKFECSKCSKTFKDNYRLKHHEITHDPDAKVKCEICGKVSKNPATLTSHMRRIHSNLERPKCDTCHRVFCHAASLRGHIAAVHSKMDRPRFPCGFPGCDKTYQTKGGLRTHVVADHVENPVRFPCTLCGKDFKTRTELEGHTSTHTTEKPYNCATCGRSFAHVGAMKRHEMTHLEASTRAMSKCRLCMQTFLERFSLQRHIRVVHENRRNFPCRFCDKRFDSASNLKRHVEARHPTSKELVHSCDKCEYKSHSKINLASHARRHLAANRECYFCGKKFLTFPELVSHSRVHTLEKLKYV